MLYALQDATIAASYAQLAAVAAGLASAWVGDFDELAVRAALNIPSELRPIALIAIGTAAEVPEETPRRPLDDMLL
jgi:nitroreductase